MLWAAVIRTLHHLRFDLRRRTPMNSDYDSSAGSSRIILSHVVEVVTVQTDRRSRRRSQQTLLSS